MCRRGFTLMELLVVIGIILVLAGLLIPTIAMIKRQAKEATCRNNLQQIGIGITAYQQSNNNYFPRTLATLFEETQALSGESERILLCPLDGLKGNDPYLGTPHGPGCAWADLSELHDANRMYPGEVRERKLPISYSFEASAIEMDYPINFARNQYAPWEFPTNDPHHPTVAWNADGRKTWADAKAYQLKHGHAHGTPFSPSQFPILRCFWHNRWNSTYGVDKERKVLNLAWDMSLIWNIPTWESEIP